MFKTINKMDRCDKIKFDKKIILLNINWITNKQDNIIVK
jgi:hypothetical protein